MTFDPNLHCPFCGLSLQNCKCTPESKRAYWQGWHPQPEHGSPEERFEQDGDDKHTQEQNEYLAGVQ